MVPSVSTSEMVEGMVNSALQHLKGDKGLIDWIKKDEKNEYAFYTKIMPKFIVTKTESVEDERAKTIRELDAKIIDVTPEKEA